MDLSQRVKSEDLWMAAACGTPSEWNPGPSTTVWRGEVLLLYLPASGSLYLGSTKTKYEMLYYLLARKRRHLRN